MKKIVLLVLNNFINDSRVLKIGRSLQKFGYQAKVIALHDRGCLEEEIVNGLNIKRIHLQTKKLPKVFFFKLIKYLEWLVKAVILSRSSDVIHCNDLNTLPVGVLIKILSLGKIKVVYDAHEFESNQIPNQSQVSILTLRFVENLLIKIPDAILTVSPGIAREYEKLYNVKTSLILNCPYFVSFSKKNNILRETLGIPIDKTIFIYQGSLTAGRGVELLLEMFRDGLNGGVLVIMGNGPLESTVKSYAQRYKSSLFFIPSVSPDSVVEYTNSADIGLIVADNVCLSYDLSLPNKFFEYMMAEIPVITSNLAEMSDFVLKNKIGVVTSENTVLGVRCAIEHISLMDKECFREKLLQLKVKFCWEEQELALKNIYSELHSH